MRVLTVTSAGAAYDFTGTGNGYFTFKVKPQLYYVDPTTGNVIEINADVRETTVIVTNDLFGTTGTFNRWKPFASEYDAISGVQVDV